MTCITFWSSFWWAFHLQQQVAIQMRTVPPTEAAMMISEPVAVMQIFETARPYVLGCIGFDLI
jgi:hypothetical protein